MFILAGEPKFKLQGLTPIHVSRIDLQATPQLKVGLSEVDFFGFEHLKPTGGNIDADTLHIKSFLPHVEIIGKYDINGKILILPIQGQGNCNITLGNIKILKFYFMYLIYFSRPQLISMWIILQN